MALKSMLGAREGWQEYRRDGQRVNHYIRETMALCGRLGFYTGDLVPAIAGAPRDNEDCAACFRKLRAEERRRLYRPIPTTKGEE